MPKWCQRWNTTPHYSIFLQIDINGDWRYKVTWQHVCGSQIMTYFCHVDELSVRFSIHKLALCVYVCVCLCLFVWATEIRRWHRRGWVAVLSSRPLIYEHRHRQWRAAELLNGTTTERSTEWHCFIRRQHLFWKHFSIKNAHCFMVVFMSYCTFKS